jgi:hypothetical protein
MPNSLNKLTPYTDGKKRKMVMNKLTAVALTARGANPHADVTFFKSKKGSEVINPLKKGGEVAVATSAVNGHQHGISIETYGGDLYLNVTWDHASGAESGHSHGLLKSSDGTYSILMADGHTHDLDNNEIKNAIFDEVTKGAQEDTITADQAKTLKAVNNDGSHVHTEDNTMPDVLQVELDAANKQLLQVQEALKTAVALGALNDAEKAHYHSLDQADQLAFVGKSSLERKGVLETVKLADPVEYTATDGTEYRKSAGVSMLSMAKRLDEQSQALTAQTELNKVANLRKRAETEMGNLPGDQAAKVALLQAVDSIADAEVLASVKTILASCNSGISKAFREIGTSESVINKGAEDRLDALVKTHATEKSISIEQAYGEVLDTAAGRNLYAEINSQQ